MKQTWKKIIGLILISVCILAMTACGKNSSEETSSLTMPDEASQQSLIESFGTVLQNISQLDEASIKSYMEGDDAFSASAASAWDASGSSLGSFEEVKDGKMKIDDDTYVVTIDAKFENRDANCVFILDKNGTPTSVSVDPVYSMGEKMAQAGQNTVMGIGIVFIMLIFLSFLISLMRFIPKLEAALSKKNKAPEQAKPAPVVAVPEVEEEEVIDDGELIAVIAAAIAASENTSTDSFVVRSIRKSKKGNWHRA